MFTLVFDQSNLIKPLQIVEFSGEDSISMPYIYRVKVFIPKESAIADFDDFMYQSASLYTDLSKGSVILAHGMVTSYELSAINHANTDALLHGTEQQFIEFCLQPRLSALSWTEKNRVFYAKNTADIIRAVLADYTWREGRDFIIQFDQKSTRVWPYKLCYQQTDLCFLSGILQQEGLHYFFVQKQDVECLVFADRAFRQDDIPEMASKQGLFQSFSGSGAASGYNLIHAVQKNQRWVPSGFSLQTEHYSLPQSIIDVSYPRQQDQKDQNVAAEVHLHHELLTDVKLERKLAAARFNLSLLRKKLKKSAAFVKSEQKDPQLSHDRAKLEQQIHEQFTLTNDLAQELKTRLVQQAEHLLELRAQAYQVEAIQYHARTNMPDLASGGYINISGHKQSDFNKSYKIVKVKHKGIDAKWLSDVDASEDEPAFIYTNEVVLLQELVPFVPFPAYPQFTMPAFIKGMIVDDVQDHVKDSDTIAENEADASDAGSFMSLPRQLDHSGYYKVQLAFDLDDPVYISIPMGLPFAGSQHGWNLPLPVGTQVIVQFIYGDPDCAVISGALPDLESVVAMSEEQHRSQLTTESGHSLIADQKGDQRSILLTNKRKDAHLYLQQGKKDSVDMRVHDAYVHKAGRGNYQVYLSDQERQKVLSELRDNQEAGHKTNKDVANTKIKSSHDEGSYGENSHGEIDLVSAMEEHLMKGRLPSIDQANDPNQADEDMAEFSYVVGNQLDWVEGDHLLHFASAQDDHYGRQISVNLPKGMNLALYKQMVQSYKNKKN